MHSSVSTNKIVKTGNTPKTKPYLCSLITDYLNDYKETNLIATNEEVAVKVPLVQKPVEDWFDVTNCADFCDHFIRAVVGHRKFDQDKRNHLLSRFVTVSDEAYALLVCENNLEKWVDMYKRQDRKKSDVIPKYTNGGRSNHTNGSSRRNKGWSSSGTRRYVQLYEFVTAQRKQVDRKLAETNYKKAKIAEYDTEKPNKKRKGSEEDETNDIVIPHSLWDDVEDNDDDETSEDYQEVMDEEDEEEATSHENVSQRLKAAHIAALRKKGKFYQA